MPSDAVYGDVQFLTGSPQRWAVMSALDEAPARPCELCEQVEATRTTIQRILSGFGDRQWVRKVDSEYRLTLTGRRVYDRYETLLAETERARELGPVAEHLGSIGDDIPDVVLDAGRITVSAEQSPLAAATHVTDWFADAEGDIRTISPIVASMFNETAAELLEEGKQITSIIDHNVLEHSADEFGEAIKEGIENGGIGIHVYESSLEFGLLVDDRGCCLGVYDDDNNLRATLTVEEPAARRWASEQFERHLADSVPLEQVISKAE